MSRPSRYPFASTFDKVAATLEVAINGLDLADKVEARLRLELADAVDDVDDGSTFRETVLRPMLSGMRRVETPPHFVVESDDLIVNKGDKVFHITVDYEDKYHYKGLNHVESYRKNTLKLPVKRPFSQPMPMQEMLDRGFILESTVKGLQTQKYQSVHVTEVDRETKKIMRTFRYNHCFTELKVYKMKKESEGKLAIEMVEYKGKKISTKTVDEIDQFVEAAVEVVRPDGQRILMYYGGTKKLLCSADASSDFLDEHFVQTHDILCGTQMLMDFVFTDMNSYVPHLLFARPVGANDFYMVNRVSPESGAGMKFQVQFHGEKPVCGIQFFFVATNAVEGHEETETTAPLCVPLHPQADCGHIAVRDDNDDLRLQMSSFSNIQGCIVSNSVLGTAGAKDGFLSEDLSILASWDMVAGHVKSD